MSVERGADLGRQAAFVGLLEDRCLSRESALGTVCLIDADRVATCAHLIVPYFNNLSALKVRFAQANHEFGVAEAFFHPEFDGRLAIELAERSLKEQLPPLALQKFNVVVLRLTDEIPALSDAQKRTINQKLSAEPIQDQGLSGDLEEVDLALVVQTLNNARRTGSLIICDERNLPRARLFCKDGRIANAQFGTVENERAIYQIFSQRLTGKFYFKSHPQPEWDAKGSIDRPADMLLIEAHRRLDEIPELLLQLGGEEAIVRRLIPELNVESISADVRNDAQMLWQHLDGTVPVARLWRVAKLDDYAVFKSLSELVKSGQVVASDAAASSLPLRPVRLGRHLALKPWDSIQIFGFDFGLDAARQASGKLLGVLANDDPSHLVHNVWLPDDAAGAPVLKDGLLIGVHCGTLPTDRRLTGEMPKTLSQFIWSDALWRCGQKTLSGPEPSDLKKTEQFSKPVVAANGIVVGSEVPGQDLPDGPDPGFTTGSNPVIPGCRELAQVECANCGSSSLDSARFCKICGQPLIEDISFNRRKNQSGSKPVVAILALAVVVLLGAVAYMANGTLKPGVFSQPGQKSQPLGSYTAADAAGSPVKLELQRADRSAGQFVTIPASDGIKPADLLRVRISVASNSFLYVLYQSSSSKDVQLHYPDSAATDTMVLADSTVTIPKEVNPHELNGFTLGGAPGTDTLLVVASPEKLALEQNKHLSDSVFFNAMHVLLSSNASGAECTTADLHLDGGIFAGKPKKVFVSTLKLTHGE